MAKCDLTINGRRLRANIGDTLVDAGIGGRILIPHDCCSGQCDTCRVTVASGAVNEHGTAEGSTVLACQATVEGDAEIRFDEVPFPVKRTGFVSAIRPLSPEIVEVIVDLSQPFEYLPGQYVSLAFRGFPARDYSPTASSDATVHPQRLHFHIKRLVGGIVSAELGGRIRPGHRVRIRGPFGSAFLRPELTGGVLVLASSGAGWAPIWSIAAAACRTGFKRDLIVLAGARNQRNLYMRSSLDWLAACGVTEVIATSREDGGNGVLPGRPDFYLPLLNPSDCVHVAGAPIFVDALARKVWTTGAQLYADPFVPAVSPPRARRRFLPFAGRSEAVAAAE